MSDYHWRRGDKRGCVADGTDIFAAIQPHQDLLHHLRQWRNQSVLQNTRQRGVLPLRSTSGSTVRNRSAGAMLQLHNRIHPQGFYTAKQYPQYIYGTEVFKLNSCLRDRAVAPASKANLTDDATTAKYRARYPKTELASNPPSDFAGATATADNWF